MASVVGETQQLSISQYILQHGHRMQGFCLKQCALPTQFQGNGTEELLEHGIDFETTVGSGRGIIKLVNTAVGESKCWVISTALEQLKNHPRNSIKDGSHKP